MYVPKHFDEPRIETLHQLIRAHPLATLVMHSSAGLDANHIPLLLAAEPGPFGHLSGHIARANPLWRDMPSEKDVLAIFQGPEAYVTPSWYPSKAENGRAVPTWNYAVVHAHGTLRVIDDATWLRTHLEQATAQHEGAFPSPWQMSDAPDDYIEAMLGAVIGIEIHITRLTGKFKLSQNQPARNREGVIIGLGQTATPAALAMAAAMTDAGLAPVSPS